MINLILKWNINIKALVGINDNAKNLQVLQKIFGIYVYIFIYHGFRHKIHTDSDTGINIETE